MRSEVLLAAAFGLATAGGAWAAGACLRLRRRAAARLLRLTLYDRLSSNNSARIRLWAYLRGEEGGIDFRLTTHAEQHSEEFRRLNPFGKVPALIITRPNGAAQWVAESGVILEYLEDARGPGRGGESYVPTSPEDRAHMNLVIRCHDLYLASPNCTQPGPFTHTQGCMYVPPPGSRHATTRWVTRSDRAAKLAECWKQLDVLEALWQTRGGPYFAGARPSLADLTVFPTIGFFLFYTPRVFGWAEGAVYHGRPGLRAWYTEHMPSLGPAVRRVEAELLATMVEKEASGILDDIRAETADTSFKWVYP